MNYEQIFHLSRSSTIVHRMRLIPKLTMLLFFNRRYTAVMRITKAAEMMGG